MRDIIGFGRHYPSSNPTPHFLHCSIAPDRRPPSRLAATSSSRRKSGRSGTGSPLLIRTIQKRERQDAMTQGLTAAPDHAPSRDRVGAKGRGWAPGTASVRWCAQSQIKRGRRAAERQAAGSAPVMGGVSYPGVVRGQTVPALKASRGVVGPGAGSEIACGGVRGWQRGCSESRSKRGRSRSSAHHCGRIERVWRTATWASTSE
ncbi:unnamed protein product [Mycena citricolor]|uniref:Uncharacterized protein n=1 Tax=Mycena citricolor TaxID=2018698 RepID=A0AAD2K7Z6_9AGAR|nr:unnamed protein product [Mycena citricolor]